ncbi:hypothetical protein SAMN02990966_07761 [Rhodospirillales bacterium URHD0017]|nr:hypothetical protein SAMN02990966_07761 [Rhodospirillales bacterium URHD0017]
MSKERGIYCIETAHWTAGRLSQPSVEPLLRLIQSTQGTPYIHRPFSTWEELHGLLGDAMHGRYRRYPILYVACHGETRRLALRRKRSNGHRNGAINLEELAIPLRQRGDGKLILFSACSLMKASEATLRRFVADTGVSAIMGYKRDVGWIESAQLELGLLAWLACRPVANGKPLGRALAELRSARDLIRELQFRIVPKKGR